MGDNLTLPDTGTQTRRTGLRFGHDQNVPPPIGTERHVLDLAAHIHRRDELQILARVDVRTDEYVLAAWYKSNGPSLPPFHSNDSKQVGIVLAWVIEQTRHIRRSSRQAWPFTTILFHNAKLIFRKSVIGAKHACTK